MKMGPVGKQMLQADRERERERETKDRQEDMTIVILAFPNFANDRKNYCAPHAICNTELLIVLFKINTTIKNYFY